MKKKLLVLVTFLLTHAVMAEPVVWDGKFYTNKQRAQKSGLIPGSRPTPALAIEISKAKKYFIGTDALIWQKRNILMQYKAIQGKMMMARLLNHFEAVNRYRDLKHSLHLQLGWINEELKREEGRWI